MSKNISKKGNLREQLETVRPAVKVTAPSLPPNVNAIGEDGVEHINIFRQGKTEIGRMLDFDHVQTFEHPQLGSFRSMYSLWYFLKAKITDDRLRKMVASETRRHVHEHCGGLRKEVPNFRGVVMHSAYLRIKANKKLTALMVNSSLPFDCYRTMPSGIRERLDMAYWVASAYEEIRTALKEKREPDFSPYLDKRGSDLYEGVLKQILPAITVETPRPKTREVDLKLVQQMEQTATRPLSETAQQLGEIHAEIKAVLSTTPETPQVALVEPEEAITEAESEVVGEVAVSDTVVDVDAVDWNATSVTPIEEAHDLVEKTADAVMVGD